ncbi:MAG: M14 family metallopeptidase [Thermodesulfobacteriota bacterium]
MIELSYGLGLSDLFRKEAILVDEDRDGHADRIGLAITVSPSLHQALIWAALINLNARLAVETAALDLPLIRLGSGSKKDRPALVVLAPGERPPETGKAGLAPAGLSRKGPGRVFLFGASTRAMARLLDSLTLSRIGRSKLNPAWRRLSLDEGNRWTAFDGSGRSIGAGRLSRRQAGLERTTGPGLGSVRLLKAFEEVYETPAGDPRGRRLIMTMSLPEDRLPALVGQVVAEIAARAALEATEVTLPLAFAGQAIDRGYILEVRPENSPALIVPLASTRGPRASGRARPLAKLLGSWAGLSLVNGGPEQARADDFLAASEKAAAKAAGINASGKVKLRSAASLRRRISWPGEVEELTGSIGRVKPGRGPVQGLLFASKPFARRQELKETFTRLLRAKGYQPDLTILNAYKPGLSWLLEVIGPRLKTLTGAADLELAYRPFTGRRRTLEMTSRWLQEVFPGPDLIARDIGFSPERIKLVRRPEINNAYRFRVWDKSGRTLLDESLTPRWSRFYYLSKYPALGLVHPTCAAVRLCQGKQILLDRNLATDRERFWKVYQDEWLPLLAARMNDLLDEDKARDRPAFFEEVRLEVHLEETDQRLGLLEERICPGEALHEDLYFNLLDFFQEFSRRRRLPSSVRLGRIVPIISAAAGNSRPWAELKLRPLTAVMTPSAEPPADRKAVTALGLAGSRLKLVLDNGRLTVRAPWPPTPKPVVAGLKVTGPPLDRLLSQEEVLDWIGRLGRLPGLTAWRAGRSWQGRPIYVLEAVGGQAGGLVSTARYRLIRPTLLFNARHHANEVSSTNAALYLAWWLASTRPGRAVAKKVNVAVIPLENADGAATLEELRPLAPDHKLHAARYNALGAEYYADYFLDQPSCPEARVKAGLWRRWLPELILDGHGVPSHEWDQPFAGYAPGRFREHWLPRSFVYAIVPYINQPDQPWSRLAGRLAGRLEQAIGRDGDLRRLNAELAGRYRRYAREPEPEVFPSASKTGLTVVPPVERTWVTNMAVRHPEITWLEIVTEVVDEVVDGPLLAHCARAHVLSAQALITFLSRQAACVIKSRHHAEDGVRFSWRRRTKKPVTK